MPEISQSLLEKAKLALISEGKLTLSERGILESTVLDYAANDNMLKDTHSSAKHYLGVGLSAIDCIDESIRRSSTTDSDIKAILDLPCGYGRVMRSLKAKFPEATLYGCEIISDAIDYCQSAFGSIPIQSTEDLASLELDATFDLIWCGSLVTHLDEHRTTQVLKFFHDHLNPGGICVFTTHGLGSVCSLENGTRNYGLEQNRILDLLEMYKTRNFGYVNYSNSKNYGISLSTTQRILEICYESGTWNNVYFKQEGWDKHQDVFSFTKRTES